MMRKYCWFLVVAAWILASSQVQAAGVPWNDGDAVMELVNDGLSQKELLPLLEFPAVTKSANKVVEGQPNLTLDIDAPHITCIEPGLIYTATLTFYNVGTADAGTFKVRSNFWGRWYPNRFNSAEGFSIAGLAAGASVTWVLHTDPFTPLCINYGIVGWVDLDNQVAESNETDNMRVDDIILQACDLSGCPGVPTATPSRTTTATPSSTLSATPSSTATSTNTGAPTATNTLVPSTSTATPTSTSSATPSGSATVTKTPTVPTATPSSTSSATASATPSRTGTATPSSTATNTAVPPTSTKTPTASPTITNTGAPTATNSATITKTPTVPTATPTSTSSATPSGSATVTKTPTVPTATPSATSSATASATPSRTGTATATGTATPSSTATNTLVPSTSTATPTNTGAPTATKTATVTSTATASATASPTITNTGAPTATNTATSTITQTPTATSPPGLPDLTVWIELLTDDLQPLPPDGCLEDLHIYALRSHISNIGSATVDGITLKVLSLTDTAQFLDQLLNQLKLADKDIAVFANLFGKEYEDVLLGSLGPGQEMVWTVRNDPFHPICNLNYGAVVKVDPDNLIEELREDNNMAGQAFLRGCCPTQTPTATQTQDPTATASSTATATETPIGPTSTPTASATVTNTGDPTATPSATASSTATASASPTPTSTQTPDAADVVVTPMTRMITLGEQNVPVCFELHNHSPFYSVASLVLYVTTEYGVEVLTFDSDFFGYPGPIIAGATATIGCVQFDSHTLPPGNGHEYEFNYSYQWLWLDPGDGVVGTGQRMNQEFVIPILVPGDPTPTATASRTATASPTLTEQPSATSTPIATSTATPLPPTETPMPTPTRTETPSGCDRGFYILDGFGGYHRVGNPPAIVGSLAFDMDLARDIERTAVNGEVDLAVLDSAGVIHFVAQPGSEPEQSFLLNFGRAVDTIVTADGTGFWVLADYGAIYRGGSTKEPLESSELIIQGLTGVIGHDVLIPSRDPNLPDPGGASLRAVGFVAFDLDHDNRAEGYVVLDSQGGHYQVAPNGTQFLPGAFAGQPDDHPYKLLDPDAYVWPFFPGLDIARDIELHPSCKGLVIFDGWGGIHPVPVDRVSNPVYYSRNDDPNNPGNLITTVGMPYIVEGFDDPTTLVDEGNPDVYGIDAASIFTDFEWSPGCPDSGFYGLDKFGGVFVFGSARATPDSTSPPWPGPYFYPYPIARGVEVFEQ